jgi:site-specific DNA-adenine methylase
MTVRMKEIQKFRALKAPFPWFGGKSRVAHLVWPRFGNVVNYVEPFAGSLAVLLGRPEKWPAKNETVNDLDCHVANFWRATQRDPEAVAAAADWPVNEADLHARHQWLHAQADFRDRMHADPDHYDVKVAGWWVWGLSAWIGDNWCRTTRQESMPGTVRQGVHCLRSDGTGLDHRRPNLGTGNGVHSLHAKRPQLGKGNRGVHRTGVHTRYACGLYDYMARLAARLRDVRVCCGDWSRVLGPSPTVHIGVTAVFLDPPYGVDDRDKVYNHDGLDIAADVREWCMSHGADSRLRIALCGYDGEHNDLEARGWSVLPWKAAGGYGRRNSENANATRERIWFSPGCLHPARDEPLFEGLEDDDEIREKTS